MRVTSKTISWIQIEPINYKATSWWATTWYRFTTRRPSLKSLIAASNRACCPRWIIVQMRGRPVCTVINQHVVNSLGYMNETASACERLIANVRTCFRSLLLQSIQNIFKTLNHLYSSFFMVFLKDRSLVRYSSSYIPLLPVLSYLIHQQTTNSMLMKLNFSYHSQL